MKKRWIIILVVVLALAGLAGAVGYLYWDDLSLLFGGEPPPAASVPAGGIDLVKDFQESEKPESDNLPGAAPADSPDEGEVAQGEGEDASAEAPIEEAKVNVQEEPAESEEEGLNLDEEVEADKPAAPTAPPKKPEKTVPTLSRNKPKAPEPAEPEESEEEAEEPPKPAAPVAPPKRTPKPAATRPEAPQEVSASVAVQKKVQGLMARKKFAEAEKTMNDYLAANPTDGDVHFIMGFLQVQQNRKGIAVVHFQKAAQNAKTAHLRQQAAQYLQKLR